MTTDLSLEADDLDDSSRKDGATAFPIIGVGASAGGLEAFTQFLRALPEDTGMAFVLVQHLAPTHTSALAEILGRATMIPVTEVRDALTVEANHIYVIPPDRSMILVGGGVLQLMQREGHGIQHPIDQFFRSLAQEQKHKAIGVVLSGTASDGTMGLEEIKAEGGITFAQDATAQHEGMPHSAIASGCVDFILSPDAIAREIVRIGQHPCSSGQWRVVNDAPKDPRIAKTEGTSLSATQIVPERSVDVSSLNSILQLIHHSTGVDFTGYRLNTLYRRIARRMVFKKMSELNEYEQFLHDTPSELDALYKEILIGVTRFFRDNASFEALKRIVFPRLLKGRSRHDPVRFWTLGCSTGQEAYSLAIAFMEVSEAIGSSVSFQLFASDLNAKGIETARAGLYPKDIAQDVSPDRLRRFFTKENGSYRISKSIRQACIFSQHNVLSDPPFSRIDLISCRNLLIYMEPALQQKIMPTLHYALVPGGCLWLGGSETIGGHRDLFEAEDIKQKIYVKKSSSSNTHSHFSIQPSGARRAPFMPMANRPSGASDLPKEADRVLLSRFAPPSVLVSAELEILQYRGDTSPYLSPVPGKSSLSLLKMLREELLVDVRAAITRAGMDDAAVRQTGLRVKWNGGYREIAIEVVPMKSSGLEKCGFLILFDDGATSDNAPVARVATGEATLNVYPSPLAADTARLEQELAGTRDYLQSIIEQQEATNEELQSASEEVQSACEELQSANEELETSKEEIQSSIEELTTVNDELHDRNAELNRVNGDLENLFDSAQLAIIILGSDLRIRRFTPMAEKFFNLVATDIGRPLVDIHMELKGLPDLVPLLISTMDSVSIQEHAVSDKHDRWYSMRLHPYKTLDNKIDGVVLVLVDVESLTRARAYTESIVATVREPLLVLNGKLCVRTASASFYRTFLVTPEQTLQKHVYELGNGQWDIPKLRRLLTEVLPLEQSVTDYEVEHYFESIGHKSMRLNARRLAQGEGLEPLILLAIEDVTDLNRQATELRQFADNLSEADHRKDEFLAMLAHELRNPLAPIRNGLQVLKSEAERAMSKGAEETGRPLHENLVTRTSLLSMMSRQVDQMVHLVDDLLDVSRISRGKIELRKVRLAIASIVDHAVEAVRAQCDSHQHQLKVTIPVDPIYVNADPARLTQIIGNLLSNACKFTDNGGHIDLMVSVEWRAASEQDGDNREKSFGNSDSPSIIPLAVIRVRDNGIGIIADQLPRIFDMFVQIDTSLERSVSGLGIGLALVKSLMKMHGGTVDAKSDGIGKGSEFVVRLPMATESSAVVQDKVGFVPSLDPPLGTDAAPNRILVVDDNRDSATSLAMLLRLQGYRTLTAFDGLEAVEAATNFLPQVILLDIGLPKLNGFEVCRRIREQSWGKKIVMVALTGWGQDEDREKSNEAGFDHHLVKPVDSKALTKLLREAIK